MSEFEPCPHCGEPPLVEYIRGDDQCCCFYCSYGQWMLAERWNQREGTPRKCCGNCKNTDVAWCTIHNKEIDFRDNGCENWEADE